MQRWVQNTTTNATPLDAPVVDYQGPVDAPSLRRDRFARLRCPCSSPLSTLSSAASEGAQLCVLRVFTVSEPDKALFPNLRCWRVVVPSL